MRRDSSNRLPAIAIAVLSKLCKLARYRITDYVMQTLQEMAFFVYAGEDFGSKPDGHGITLHSAFCIRHLAFGIQGGLFSALLYTHATCR